MPFLDGHRDIRYRRVVQIERVAIVLDDDFDVSVVDAERDLDCRMTGRRMPFDVVDDLVQHDVKVMPHVVRHAMRGAELVHRGRERTKSPIALFNAELHVCRGKGIS
jgi:hypothetical protein